MKAVEFSTELTPDSELTIPPEIFAKLPKSGRVRVILLTSEEEEEVELRLGAYEQFLREDPSEDSVYDRY